MRNAIGKVEAGRVARRASEIDGVRRIEEPGRESV